MSKNRYRDSYNRLLPMRPSVNAFITLYLLHLLNENEKLYGKEMIDMMMKRFKGSWTPSHGLVYPILKELEEDGLIKGTWTKGATNRSIKEYELTKAGRSVYNVEKKYMEKDFNATMTMIETFMVDIYNTEMIDFSQQ